MAKNVLQKKQRIAHNKTFNGDHEMLPGDLLSSIMEGMDNSHLLPPMHSTTFEADLLEFSKTQSQKKTANIQIPSQNPLSVPKSKKFGLSRKFPLMEKSQRALKQIRHNRKMPKPRAHLAGLPNSPVIKSPSLEKRTVLKEKLKKQTVVEKPKKQTIVNSVKNTVNYQKNSTKEPNLQQNKSPILKNNSSVKESSLKTTSKKQENPLTKENSEKSRLETDKITDNSSDSDDYEKFIQKEKKGLPKKTKSQISKKKPNSSTVSRKRNLKTAKPLSESDSDSDDETLSKSYKKSKKRNIGQNRLEKSKKRNIAQTRQSSSNEDSEYDMVNDEPCRESSSESDELTPLSSLKSNLQSSRGSPIVRDNYSKEDESLQRNLYIPPSVEYDQTNVFQKTSDTASLVVGQSSVLDKMPCSDSLKSVNQSSAYTVVSNIEPSVSKARSHFQPGIYNKSSNSGAFAQTTHGTSTSAVGMGAYSTKNDLLNVSVKQESSNKSLIVDLTESDNECDNSFTIMPKIVMTSSQSVRKSPINTGKVDTDEDSEIEMVDVIVHDMPKKPKSSGRNVEPNPSNNTGELHIKTELNPGQVPLPSNANAQKTNLPLPPSPPKISVKNEAVFSTDICKDNVKKEPEDKSNLKRDKRQISLDIADENPPLLNKKVKTEPSDDCEIIFDAVSNNNTSQNLHTVQSTINKPVKIEKAVKETTGGNNQVISREEKILPKEKDVCSSLKNITDTCQKNLALLREENMPNPSRAKTYLEKLKNAYSTLREIQQTEQSVEATFKMLQMSQAEKVKAYILLIRKELGNLPGDSEHSNAIKEISKQLEFSELSRQKLMPLSSDVPSASIPSPDISINDIKTFASMNIVPLSSISEKDIKPNVAELQSSIKKEPGTSEEINSMSFGEKCIVCAKDAAAACQQCAKVFFCSHECGKKYWNEGHKDACAK